MSVATPHADYTYCYPDWIKIRDVMAGERAVKAAGTKYLPRLSDQEYYEYRSYLDRALFFNASARTVQGLLGALFRKPMTFDGVESIGQDLEDQLFDGRPFSIFAKDAAQEVLSLGRYGILVDHSPDGEGKPYMAGFRAEQIINWRYETQAGRPRLAMVVLQEKVYTPNDKNPFHADETEQYRVLRLNEDGVYQQDVYEQTRKGDFSLSASYIPTYRGQPFENIPFVFIGPVSLTASIEKSPILDLVNVNLSHYRSSADLEHGRHFTALPTPYVTAPSFADGEEIEYKIGPSNVWLLEPGGSAGMLEFRGAGLSFIENACREKERMMAVLGARLLEDAKRGVEAAETVRLRHIGESSTLASIAETVARALTKALQIWAGWADHQNAGSVQVYLNKDFFTDQMSPAQIQALVSAWQAGALSYEALQENLKMGEII